MDTVYDILRFAHVMSFVFMSVPLFNLIVVNERASLSKSFNYDADRYMENIIKNGAHRCFVFQSTVLVTGVMLVITGPLGLGSLWSNWVVAAKVVLLAVLMALLSYVHFKLQPRIESIFLNLKAGSELPKDLAGRLKLYRVRRKWMATLCLFFVITSIVLGLQVYGSFKPVITILLIALGALFALKANKTLLRFGWI
ncbi:MAG: hypothetical protein OEN01_02580 [Candidatus Krumholzibacteria bacterium]|nr:hypothetical protein [Candidatus Krumholzibacteria bacterium]